MCDKKQYRMGEGVNAIGLKYYFLEEYLLGEWLQVLPRRQYLNYAIAAAELDRLTHANSAKITPQAEATQPKPELQDWAAIKFAESQAEHSIKTETYHSSTHGYIKLSFTGRRLLANLRSAIQDAIRGQNYSFNDQAVAKARGDLASYMHQLESKAIPPLANCTSSQLYEELARRGQTAPSFKQLSTSKLWEELSLRLGL